MQPLVSILVPAYNSERWISSTLLSALQQTWPRKEIIVVDDGSKDATLAIARTFASSAISVVSQDNQGAAAARNRAFSLCQGDYIQWLDADDLLSQGKIALQMQAAEECQDKHTLLSSGWGSFMSRHTKAKFTPTSLWCDLPPLEWLLRKWEQNSHMQTATWLVSRELTEAAGPWDIRLLADDDGEYFFRVIRASTGICFVPEAKVFYRITPSARLSHIGRSRRKIEAQFFGMKLQIGYLLALTDNERGREACVSYLKAWLPHFYPDRMDIVKEAQVLAEKLGGRLDIPRMRWKYAWIEKLFGSHAAKEVQIGYNRGKSWTLRRWDGILHSIERSGPDREVPR